MKAGINVGSLGCLVAGILVGQAAIGLADGSAGMRSAVNPPEVSRKSEDGRKHKGPSDQQREAMKVHWEAQREAMKAVMAIEDPNVALKALREYRVSQHDTMVKFHEKMWDNRMAEVGKKFVENNVPQERREAILKKMIAQKESRTAEGEKRYEAMLKALDEVAAKEGLTKKDIRTALQNVRQREGDRGVGSREMKKKRERGAGEVKAREQKKEGRGKKKADIAVVE